MKLKKFSTIIYFLMMALLVFSLSGCGHSDDDNVASSSTNTAASPLMVLTSNNLVSGDEYTIYRGSNVSVTGTEAKYYVAPAATTGGQELTMNLEFSGNASNDLPYIICDSTGTNVLFSYNPNGTGNDTNTPYGSVIRNGAAGSQLSYTGLELSNSVFTSAIELDDETKITEIVLSSTDKSATVNGATITPIDAIWYLSPDVGEYWTYNGESFDMEEDFQAEITSTDGVYIAYDIRYVPDTLEFKEDQTATKANGNAEGDSDKLYVVYYNEGATNSTSKKKKSYISTYAVQSADTYILAALPNEMGMGAQGGFQPGQQGNQPQPGQQGGGGFQPVHSQASLAATNFDTVVSAMTHSASKAKGNPVLHITAPGVYKISGTWQGQIWVDIPDESVTDGTDSEDDPKAQVILILNGVTVNCSVAPALVFKNVYECGTTDSDVAQSTSMDVYQNLVSEDDEDNLDLNAGAIVLLAGGETNTLTGANVARINKLKLNSDDGYVETADSLKYVKSLKKMYKLDGALHSRMSMVIANASASNPGTLVINASYEGLDSEEHMYIESGVITINAADDGINVNDDDTSVFHMDGGSLTVVSTGGDGIDSNGYIIFTSADKLSVTASSNNTKPTSTSGLNAQAEGPLDADCGIYMSEAVFAIYTVGDGSASTTPTTDPTTENTETTTNQSTAPQTDTIGNVATVTYQAKITNDTKSQLTKDQRVALGVKESGNTFKLIERYNDFTGVK